MQCHCCSQDERKTASRWHQVHVARRRDVIVLKMPHSREEYPTPAGWLASASAFRHFGNSLST